MRSRTKQIALSLAAAVVVVACGTADDAGGIPGTSNGSGGASIAISGSSTVEPISALVAEKFNAANPDVAIAVEGPGTGDGFVRFCAGEVDIANASRAIDEEEVASCSDAGVEYVELRVAYDGITVITSLENSAVSCLSTADLYALIGPESEGFGSWSDANDLAVELGGTGGFPDAPLSITAPGEESGTFDAFVELALEDIGEERLGEVFADDPTRADYNPSANDNVIVETIGGDPTSLGWVGFAFAEENAGTLSEIQIDGGAGCVAPTIETIADGSYPLSRSLYIYVNAGLAAGKPELVDFVDFYLGDGISSVTEAGYVALPDELLTETTAAWEAVRP